MKIKKWFKEILYDSQYGLKRFPVTMTISSLLVITLIMLNEGFMDDTDNLTRISMILGLGIPLSILIKLGQEAYLKTLTGKTISYLIGAIFLAAYYFLFLRQLGKVADIRYIGTMITLILGCAFVQRLKNRNNYEKYIINILNGVFITGIYAIVLYLGIIFIIFTIEQLFEVQFISGIYYYVFLTVIFIFGAAIFLSKYPEYSYEDSDYPKAFKALLAYILIPLISIYSLILYAYFIKIMVTWEWPKGLVSHLVIWYSTLSVFVIFFILPILEENNIARYFRKYFPIINIPILIMMFISIGQRIGQYGFTENRYYVLLLGIWILVIMLHFIIKKPKSNTFIMTSLSVFVLVSVFGPLSSFNVAIRSQNNRLNDLLAKNNILVDGELTANENVPSVDRREISNILSYFESNHRLGDVDVLYDGYNLNRMGEDFGFTYNPDNYLEAEPYYYYNEFIGAIDISDYDYYIDFQTWASQRKSVSDLSISYNNLEFTLTISNGDEEMIIDIEEEARLIHKDLEFKGEYDTEDLSVVIEDIYKVKIIFKQITIEDTSSDDVALHGSEFILLLDYNK